VKDNSRKRKRIYVSAFLCVDLVSSQKKKKRNIYLKMKTQREKMRIKREKLVRGECKRKNIGEGGG